MGTDVFKLTRQSSRSTHHDVVTQTLTLTHSFFGVIRSIPTKIGSRTDSSVLQFSTQQWAWPFTAGLRCYSQLYVL